MKKLIFILMIAVWTKTMLTFAEETTTEEKLVSLTFEDADIRTVLRTFARLGNVNIVASEKVTGKITLELRNVSWDVAFNTVLKVHGLTAVKEKDLIGVMTLEESEANKKLTPVETKIYNIKYAKAQSIEKSISPMLTERGKTQIDERTNSIIVTDIPNVLKTIEELIDTIDIPTPQVMIDAKIVEVDYKFGREIGIKWFAGNLTDPTTDTHIGDSLDVSVAGVNKLIFGTLVRGVNLDAVLSMLEREHKAKILSQPKIAVMDNEEAMILSGKKIPIVTLDLAGNRIIKFYDVALKLTVTPHINPKNQIIMELKPELSDLAGEATVEGGIIILSTEATTKLLVDDGETAVIGGVIKEKTSTVTRGIPYLCKIPLLGRLFKSVSKATDKVELMIFVTPHIIPVKKK